MTVNENIAILLYLGLSVSLESKVDANMARQQASVLGFRAMLMATATLALALMQQAAPILQEARTIALWDGRAPGALGDDERDTPTLTIYMPPNTAGPLTAVVIAPGGSYQRLSMNNEGRAPAAYFNALGVAAFVLRYRLGPQYHHPVELGDAQRAIRLVRAHAAEWHVAPDRVGIMGFSAGGHLAATASTQFDRGSRAAADPLDRVSSRPDFAILASPVVSLAEPWTHQLSNATLLGEGADADLARRMSAHTRVTSQTPPTFSYHTTAATTVPVENSLAYFLALRKAGVPAERHIFKDGRHG